MLRSKYVMVLALLMLLILAACGGGDDANSADDADNSVSDSGAVSESSNDDTPQSAFTLVDAPDVTVLGTGRALSMALSPDDATIAVGLATGFIHLYDAADLDTAPIQVDLNGQAYDLAFSPDGTQLAVANPAGSVHAIDPATGEIIWEGFTPREPGALVSSQEVRPNRLTYSPDGSLLAVAFDDRGIISLLDPATGEVLRVLESSVPFTNRSSIAFTPDGTQIIGSYGSRDTQVYNVETGEVIVERLDEIHANAIAISPDGSSAAMVNRQGSSETYLSILNTADLTTTVETTALFEDALAYTADGETLIVGQRGNGNNYMVQAYSAADLTPGGQFPVMGATLDIALSSDESTIYALTESGLYAVETATLLAGDAETVIEDYQGQVMFSGIVTGVDLTDDLTQAVVCEASGTLSVYDVATGERTNSMPLANAYDCDGYYSADETFAVIRVGQEVYGFDMESGESTLLFRVSNSRAISNDATVIAAAFGPADRPLDVFELADNIAANEDLEPAREIDLSTVPNLARLTTFGAVMNADGSRFAPRASLTAEDGSTTYTVLVIDPIAGEVLMQADPWTEIIRSQAISADGSTLAMIGYEDLGLDGDRIIAQVIDISGDAPVTTDIEISDPNNDELRIESVAVSDDGGLVALQASDSVLHLYDTAAGEIVASFASRLPFEEMHFMPGSSLLLSYDGSAANPAPNSYGAVFMWDLAEYLPATE